MDTDAFGQKLLELFDGGTKNYAEIQRFLENLFEDQRRDVVRYEKNLVSEC